MFAREAAGGVMAHWVGDSENPTPGTRDRASGTEPAARRVSSGRIAPRPGSATAAGDRRRGDRRVTPTPMFSRYTLIGRRREPRRDGERVGVYVDRLDGHAVLLVVLVLILSTLDAVFTLSHLGRGGREANPIMDWAIRLGPGVFLAVKGLLTMTGMVLLVVHRFFRGVRPLLLAILLVYTGLMAYHLYLATIL
jgi:hypothetical protein